MQFSKLIAILPLLLAGVFSMPVVSRGTDVAPETDSGYESFHLPFLQVSRADPGPSHFHYDEQGAEAATQKRTDAHGSYIFTFDYHVIPKKRLVDQEADAAYGRNIIQIVRLKANSSNDHFHYIDAEAQQKRAEQTGRIRQQGTSFVSQDQPNNVGSPLRVVLQSQPSHFPLFQ
ncbi:uncharacterized protein PAC_09129 [Phialocephala subalpina]|uniref:Uncharacterized protein n=1 Tax=Phialocephala subalpina TaxID=576137 RepID=A0A1L7X2J6_9HELO|nr:uncharacterized protein PAC_09129 [Phialocephala subalpina]